MNDADDDLIERRSMADAALRRAIELHAEAWFANDDPDHEHLADFIVITAWQNFENNTVSYGRATSGGDAGGMPHHVGLGLLERGLMSLRREIDQSDDEE